MNCYYHPDRPAVGVCKHCQRGLCSESAAVIEDVLACKNRHEEEVMALELLTARNLFQSRRVGATYMRTAIFYGLVGTLFAVFGWIQYRFLGLQALFFILIGLFLLYAAAANYFEGRKHKK
jgi:hypothetical protein